MKHVSYRSYEKLQKPILQVKRPAEGEKEICVGFEQQRNIKLTTNFTSKLLMETLQN